MASDAQRKEAAGAGTYLALLACLVFLASCGLLVEVAWDKEMEGVAVGAPPPGTAAQQQARLGSLGVVNNDAISAATAATPPPPPPPPPKKKSVPPPPTVDELAAIEKELRDKVSAIKSRGTVMEKDPEAIAATKRLQDATMKLLLARFGDHGKYGGPATAKGTVFHVEMQVQFPDNMPDIADKGKTGTILVETAPVQVMPHAVMLFLDIATAWNGGAFHRNAGHVLQVQTNNRGRGLAFQEYSAKYPHVEGTLGFAGRPGGPPFYISTIDNTRNHGPASQGSASEADSCFGRVLDGKDVVQRLFKVWGTKAHGFRVDRMGFLSDTSQNAAIVSMKIL